MPRWFMQDHHMSPTDTLRAAKIMNARINIPMHFGTFSLGDDGYFGAHTELTQLLKETGPSNFLLLGTGESYTGILRTNLRVK